MSPTQGPVRRSPLQRRGEHGKRGTALRTVTLAVVLFASVTGCSTGEFIRLGMPEPITKEAEVVLDLWQGSWITAFAVGVVVWGLIIWSVIFHRKRSESLPPQVRYNLPIEVLYTVLPFIMVSVLFYFTVRDGQQLENISKDHEVVVDVTGFQWSWRFEYPASGVSVVGQPVDRYQEGPTLVIPEDTPIRFNLTSEDVIHSFWVPAFLFKRDVVPGHPNHFTITATEQGSFAGRCSELCGTYHSRMMFTLKVVSPEEFDRFIARQQAQSQQTQSAQAQSAEAVAGSTQ